MLVLSGWMMSFVLVLRILCLSALIQDLVFIIVTILMMLECPAQVNDT